MRAQAGGKNVVPDVHEVLGRIKAFSERVRSGEWKGATGKPIQSFVIIGIAYSVVNHTQAMRMFSSRNEWHLKLAIFDASVT